MNDEQTELERLACRWLAGTLSWEAQLQRLRIRADLALAGPSVTMATPQRDHLVALTASSRPEVTGWDERLDRTA